MPSCGTHSAVAIFLTEMSLVIHQRQNKFLKNKKSQSALSLRTHEYKLRSLSHALIEVLIKLGFAMVIKF